MLKLLHRATYAEYLAVEQNSDVRHEFIDGVVVAMSGGSFEHSTLSLQFGALLGSRIGGSCFAHSNDTRFWIESTQRGRYADGSIICGPPMRAEHDKHAAINPVVVFEVLSPSTQEDDDGDKRIDWQSLSSLEAYVLISQDARRVKIYRREGHTWGLHVYRDGNQFALPRLTSVISVDEVYDRILDADGRSLLVEAALCVVRQQSPMLRSRSSTRDQGLTNVLVNPILGEDDGVQHLRSKDAAFQLAASGTCG